MRNLNKVDWTRFNEMLSPSQAWYDALDTKDVDVVWNDFLNSVISALDTVAPLRQVSVRNFISSSSISVVALRHKRRCFRNLSTNQSLQNLIMYERAKLILQRLFDQDRASRENNITKSKHARLFWSYINRRISKDNSIKSINPAGATITDAVKISNIFNDYFSSIYSTDSPSTNLSHPDVSPYLSSTLSVIPLTVDDVVQVIRKLPLKSSVDADNLSYKILKNGGFHIAYHIFHLFSLSLELSRVPSSWKCAIIKPIFTKGSKLTVTNYRPINVTSCCSRILERIINTRIIAFLSANDLISQSQHGFLKGKSTDTILIRFYDFVTNAIDQNLLVDSIFFDFRKAFDTVPHSELLSRIHSVGIRGPLLAWITNFLSNRSQKVCIGHSFSRSLPVGSGVIQGSVLGPTLFNIFTNDHDNSFRHCNILKYADDIRIYLAANKSQLSLLDMQRRLQEDIDNLVTWSLHSGLKLNVEKCFSVSFGRHISTRSYVISNCSIPRKTEFSDLGLSVYSSINFQPHVNKVVSKCFTKLGLINKILQIIYKMYSTAL